VTDLLAQMVRSSRQRARAGRASIALERPPSGRPGGRLFAALTAPAAGTCAARGRDELAVIAEIKRRSPSLGCIAPHLDAVARARAYESAGADAVSVLTEPDRFGGSLEDLRAVAESVDVPVVRKDFVVDPYQVWEAADAGAAAVLLIVAALPGEALRTLVDECRRCGLDALVEVHTAEELRRACVCRASLVGVNNRDLRSLEVDLSVAEELGPLVPPPAVFVSESGIQTPEHARRVRAAGARAILVGEALVGLPVEELAPALAGLRGGDPAEDLA
jgi:indole-3-glycerol phosphate synthase